MPGPTLSSVTQATTTLAQAARALTAPSLSQNIAKLRQSRSSDPIQQAQSDAIVQLYDAVREIQLAIWPMLAGIPDVSGVRDAAQQAGLTNATTAKSSATLAAFRRP